MRLGDAGAQQAVVQPTAAPLRQATVPPPAPEDRAAGPHHTVVAFRWENDVVGGTDDNYTDGVSLTLSREGRGPLGGFWKWFGPANGRLVSSYELGQMMFTPRDLRRAVPDPADRPYAGVLFAGLSTEYVHDNRLDALKLVAGIVGPASLAAQAQKVFHSIIRSPEPEGWAYQLKNEPIVNMVYEQRRRYTLLKSATGWGADTIPVVGGMLGTFLIQATASRYGAAIIAIHF